MEDPTPPVTPSAPPPRSGVFDVLGILNYVYGGLMLLVTLCPAFYIVLGVLMISGVIDGSEFDNDPNAPPPEFIFFLMGSCAVFPIVYAALAFLCAGRLRARRGHTLCLVNAILQCLNMPLGTALGVTTIIFLLQADKKAEFDQAQAVANH
ncbi:MAG: hypothetical protein AAGI54_12725 [Planctomycetota bacterium]